MTIENVIAGLTRNLLIIFGIGGLRVKPAMTKCDNLNRRLAIVKCTPPEQTFIVHPVNIEQGSVIKAFFKALQIKFEIVDEIPYNKDFIDMVLQADDSIKKGKGKLVTSDEFDNLWKILLKQ
jgi:hypothetical protein